MKNKKARVLCETQGLTKSFDKRDFKPFCFPRQYFCSFCWRSLPDNSIRFGGIGACPVHFKLAETLINGLRRNEREYSKRFCEVKR